MVPALTAGERQVAHFFADHLDPSWELYVQPHMNGVQPDFVLVNPDIGIGVFEVKDWNPATPYWVTHQKRADDAKGPQRGRVPGHDPVLWGRYPDRWLGGTVDVAVQGNKNPFDRVREYKSFISRICTNAVRGTSGYGLITAGVIFTRGDSSSWSDLGAHFVHDGEPGGLYPVVGEDALAGGFLRSVYPRVYNVGRGLMSDDLARFLRGWLREPAFVAAQREPLVFSPQQKKLVDGAVAPGVRWRLRGPAGSGKSLVLSARAACLALQGKRVLVCGFNITLSHYLHDLAVRHLRSTAGNSSSYYSALRRLTFDHFHHWAFHPDLYAGEDFEFFDAILVDEGQDFELAWWDRLVQLWNPSGEMMLVFDRTQDLYRRAGSWTESNMRGAGFKGGWRKLSGSYRCHHRLLPALKSFAEQFMQGEYVDLPVPVQGYLTGFEPLDLRWVQLSSGGDWVPFMVDEVSRMWNKLADDSGYSDIVSLIPEHLDGYRFVSALEEYWPGLAIGHIFSDHHDSVERQRESVPLKHQFWGGNGKMKVITVHSFKGWEGRHLVVYVDRINDSSEELNMAILFYVALTRLVQHMDGSSLTIVSSCPELRDFGKEFFPDFVES